MYECVRALVRLVCLSAYLYVCGAVLCGWSSIHVCFAGGLLCSPCSLTLSKFMQTVLLQDKNR